MNHNWTRGVVLHERGMSSAEVCGDMFLINRRRYLRDCPGTERKKFGENDVKRGEKRPTAATGAEGGGVCASRGKRECECVVCECEIVCGVSAGVLCGNGQGFPKLRSCLTGWQSSREEVV